MGVAHPRRPAGPRGGLLAIGIAAVGLLGVITAGGLTAGAADPDREAAHFHAVVMDPASAPSPAHGAPRHAPELPATGAGSVTAPVLGGLALASAYSLSRSGRARPARH